MKAYKIKAWVARDERETNKESSLFLYRRMPKRFNDHLKDAGFWSGGGEFMAIPDYMFPELTWEDEPKEIEVTIKAK